MVLLGALNHEYPKPATFAKRHGWTVLLTQRKAFVDTKCGICHLRMFGR